MAAPGKGWLVCAGEGGTSEERGCGLANTAAELTPDGHPGRRTLEKLKTQHPKRPPSLLLEGARVSRQAAGSKGPSAKFTATAEAVIATFQSRTKVSPKSGVRKRTK